MPSLDGGHSIQVVIRQVMILLMRRQIDQKSTGLMLYGCQIASTNLRRMEEEKPQPTEVVVEPERVGETPLGMTPWSASGEGHDPEPDEENYEDDEEEDDDEDEGPSYEKLEEKLKEERRVSIAKHTYSEQLIATCRIDARNRVMRIRDALNKETTFEGLQRVMAEVAKVSEIEMKWENWAQRKMLPLQDLLRTLARPIATSD